MIKLEEQLKSVRKIECLKRKLEDVENNFIEKLMPDILKAEREKNNNKLQEILDVLPSRF